MLQWNNVWDPRLLWLASGAVINPLLNAGTQPDTQELAVPCFATSSNKVAVQATPR